MQGGKKRKKSRDIEFKGDWREKSNKITAVINGMLFDTDRINTIIYVL